MGSEYGLSPFQVLQILGPSLVVGPVLIWFLIFGPLLIYPLARWKQHREAHVDPQLGLKVALHFFALVAFQVALFAGFVILYTVLSKAEGKSDGFRMGFALLVPAGLVLGVHLALLARTNQHAFPAVRRLFLGYNLLLTGLLGFLALITVFYYLLRRGGGGDDVRFAIAATLVYVSAWAVLGVQFGRLVLGDDQAGVPPQQIIPPGASAPTQTSGPMLPPLSAGSFPPLDQK